MAVRRGLLGIALVREVAHELQVHGADGARRHLVAVVVEHLHVGADPRPPDGAGVREPLLRARQRAAAFGRAVELVDHRTQPREQPPLELDRAGRGRVDHLPQRRHVVLRAHVLGQRHQPVQLRGHHGDVGDAVLVDQLQRALGVPLLHEHDGVLEVQREVPEVERARGGTSATSPGAPRRRRARCRSGSGWRCTPPPRSRGRTAGRSRCTAFGRPVVPDVYCMNWPGDAVVGRRVGLAGDRVVEAT